MEKISVEVWLYGPLARYGGDPERTGHASLRLELPRGCRIRDLLAALGLPTEERGMSFINGGLSAMPGVQPDLDHALRDGDRVAFFHLKSMWPAQYRHGVALAPGLAKELKKSGDEA